MPDLTPYIDVLVAAPIAVLFLVTEYLRHKREVNLINRVIEQQNKLISGLSEALTETIKIIKQIQRL